MRITLLDSGHFQDIGFLWCQQYIPIYTKNDKNDLKHQVLKLYKIFSIQAFLQIQFLFVNVCYDFSVVGK